MQSDREAWQQRDLSPDDIVRLTLDGTVVRVRLDRKATSLSLLVALGVRRDGQKALLALRNMGGESEAAWRALLDDLAARGLGAPELAIVDGATGLEAALAALWNEVPVQRCTVHKHRHLLAVALVHEMRSEAEMPLVVLGLSPGTINFLVERLGQARQIGDDEAAVGALGTGLDAGDDAALDLVPAFGGVAEIAVAPNLFSLACEATQSGVFGERADLAQQHRIAGEPEDVADTLALAPRHRLGPAVMAVAAHDDLDCRPASADAADDMTQHQRHLGPVRRLAGAQSLPSGLTREMIATGLPVVAS